MAPTAFIFRKKHPHKAKWGEMDYACIEAIHFLDKETCSSCGLPVYICRSDDPHIRFRVQEVTCAAKEAVERVEESRRDSDKDYRPKPGTSLRPIPYTTDGSDFAKYRDAYYREDWEKQKEILEGLRSPDVS